MMEYCSAITAMDTCSKWVYEAKWKKPDWKAYLSYDSIYLTFWKRKNHRDKELISAHQGLWEGRGLWLQSGSMKKLVGLVEPYPDYVGDYTTLSICQGS